MNVLRLTLLSASLLLITACASNTGKKEIDYRAASTQVPTLEVPPDLTAISVNDRYQIPGDATTYSEYSSQGGDLSPRIEPVLPQSKNARIERSGTERWLVVNDSPENIWAKLESFWPETGLPIKTRDRTAGIMETDWVENKANIPEAGLRKLLGQVKVLNNLYSSGTRDSYLTRLERSQDGIGTEVYISHKAMEEVGEGTATHWEARPSDPDMEAIVLQRLLVFLGGKPESIPIRSTPKQSNAAPIAKPMQAAVPAPVSSVVTPSVQAKPIELSQESASASSATFKTNAHGDTTLVIGQTRASSWSSIGKAIQQAGYAITQEDAPRGIYYISSKKAESGITSKFKFWGQSDLGEIYRVKVSSVATQTHVNVVNKYGRKDKISEQILSAIHEQLK